MYIIKVDFRRLPTYIFSDIVLMTISEYDDQMFVFCRYNPLCTVLIRTSFVIIDYQQALIIRFSSFKKNVLLFVLNQSIIRFSSMLLDTILAFVSCKKKITLVGTNRCFVYDKILIYRRRGGTILNRTVARRLRNPL